MLAINECSTRITQSCVRRSSSTWFGARLHELNELLGAVFAELFKGVALNAQAFELVEVVSSLGCFHRINSTLLLGPKTASLPACNNTKLIALYTLHC